MTAPDQKRVEVVARVRATEAMKDDHFRTIENYARMSGLDPWQLFTECAENYIRALDAHDAQQKAE